MSHDTPRPMRLHLLAAPRLLVDGEVVHLGSRKALALLAVLALDGGTTRERLAALLWPEVDSAGGRRNLRRELFRLREFGVPLLDAPDGTLALDSAFDVDAVELLQRDRLVDVGGTALEGLDGLGSPELDAWLQRWRDQIAQQHAGLVEHEAQACEQRGNLAAALALRTRRWAADPCNEAAALQVMRLHTDLGDRAAALQAYQRLADCLRDELDVLPSEGVRQFMQTLKQEIGHARSPPAEPVAGPAPAAPLPGDGASAAQALPAVVPFVARAAAQQRIEAAWARGQRVYLHGAPGAGKTRLASELAAARGPWLRVACEPQDSELPYASVVRVLRALRASAPDVVLPDWVQRELAQLMPELGAPLPVGSTDDARQRLLAAVGEAWGLLMRDNFSALVLDDWHWGDPASVTLWSRLDDGSGAAAVAWIIAFRSAQLPRAALERQRADLDSQRGVAVALEGMDDAEVLALTHALSGAPGGRLFSQRLRHATEGNPFFLLETLRHLFEQGLLTADAEGWSTPFDEHTQDYAELPVPPSVRATVQARVRALGAPLQRVLEIASLGSVDIDAHLLAATSDMDEEAAIAALEHAAAAQLVQETGSGWRFTHDLVRQSLMQGLSAGRRRLLHERLALRLERADAQPALVAAHWEAAQQPARAIRWRVAAAESALRVHALDAALASYAQALADGAQGAVAATIQQGCARVHMRRADHAAADAAFAEATAAAASDAAAGPDEVLRLQLEQAEYWCTTDRVEAALAVLEALAPELSKVTPALRAKALAVRGAGLARLGRYSTAEALMSEAEGLLEGVPESRLQLAELLLNLARSSQWRGDADASGRHARRAVAVYESLGDRVGLVKSLGLLAQFHKALGERDEAVALGERARALAARCGDVPLQRDAIFSLVRIGIDLGDTDRVTALLDEGEALGPVFESRMMRGNFLAARYYVHFLRGELQAAHAAATRLLDASRNGMPLLHLGYLHIVCDLFLLEGDTDGARALIDEAQDICDAQRAAGEKVWFLNSQAYYRAQLAVDTGRPQDALALLGEAEDSVELDERFKQAWIGAAAARALGDLADAARRLAIVDIDADPPSDQLAHWLEQRLGLAAAEGRRDAAGLARAQALLAERRVPMLLVERLQRAIDAVPR